MDVPGGAVCHRDAVEGHVPAAVEEDRPGPRRGEVPELPPPVAVLGVAVDPALAHDRHVLAVGAVDQALVGGDLVALPGHQGQLRALGQILRPGGKDGVTRPLRGAQQDRALGELNGEMAAEAQGQGQIGARREIEAAALGQTVDGCLNGRGMAARGTSGLPRGRSGILLPTASAQRTPGRSFDTV